MGNILIKILLKDTKNILTSSNSRKLKANLSDIRNKNKLHYKNNSSISKDYIKISKEDKISIIDN